MMPAVRQALKEVDPQKPAHGLNALEDLMGATYARDRQTMVTLLVFASAAIFLAVLSVYGVLSQRVRERSREISIRMALGADGSRPWHAIRGRLDRWHRLRGRPGLDRGLRRLRGSRARNE